MRLSSLLLAVSLWLSLLPGWATAQSAEEFARDSSAQLLAIIQAEEANYAADPGPARAAMAAFLGEVVDFDRIAKGVMGKHGKAASEEQLARFKQTFSDGLVSAYTDALMGFGATAIDVTGVKGKKADRKSVDLVARGAEGAKVGVRYSVAKRAEQWRVQNLTIEGINLGLTFRNQFNSSMAQHGGDIDKVIDRWHAQ